MFMANEKYPITTYYYAERNVILKFLASKFYILKNKNWTSIKVMEKLTRKRASFLEFCNEVERLAT